MIEDLAAIFSNKCILITGGLGFIGSNLTLRLARLGAKVTLVDLLIPEHGGNRPALYSAEPKRSRKEPLTPSLSDFYEHDGHMSRTVKPQAGI